MDGTLLAQFVINGLMLGMMYALVAVGFTLFFGVLDTIVFSHGDTVMIGAFSGLATYTWLTAIYPNIGPLWTLIVVLAVSIATVSVLGILLAGGIIVRLRSAPALNTLLATMMLGTVLREAVRLFYPDGSNSQPFPKLLPDVSWVIGGATVRLDSILLFACGLVIIAVLHTLITRTRLGMAIRAVAQDAEAAQLMGVNFIFVVLLTFIIGSAVAAFAGVMNGIYYGEVNFSMGVLMGAIGFSAAVIGGLGNVYGAILGGFIFSFLQTIGAVALPFSSAYKDVFAFGVIILLLAWKPRGLLAEQSSQRV